MGVGVGGFWWEMVVGFFGGEGGGGGANHGFSWEVVTRCSDSFREPTGKPPNNWEVMDAVPKRRHPAAPKRVPRYTQNQMNILELGTLSLFQGLDG